MFSYDFETVKAVVITVFSNDVKLSLYQLVYGEMII